MSKDFRVGDKVTDIKKILLCQCSKGTVINIDDMVVTEYPIKVRFNDGTTNTYSKSGKEYQGELEVLAHGHNVSVKIEGEQIPVRKKTVWVNVYINKDKLILGMAYDSEVEAKNTKSVLGEYLKTISLEIPEE